MIKGKKESFFLTVAKDKYVVGFYNDDEMFHFKILIKIINLYIIMKIICLNLKKNMKL